MQVAQDVAKTAGWTATVVAGIKLAVGAIKLAVQRVTDIVLAKINADAQVKTAQIKADAEVRVAEINQRKTTAAGSSGRENPVAVDGVPGPPEATDTTGTQN